MSYGTLKMFSIWRKSKLKLGFSNLLAPLGRKKGFSTCFWLKKTPIVPYPSKGFLMFNFFMKATVRLSFFASSVVHFAHKAYYLSDKQ